MKRVDTEEFIRQSKIVHGDKYDYSKSIYVDAKTELTIVCKEHGEFVKTPTKHTHGKQGCQMCALKTRGLKRRKGTDSFIKSAKEVHGDKYTYDKTVYTLAKKDVVITCPIHGDFTKLPYNHISGQGCPECSSIEFINNCKNEETDIINRFREKHGDLFDYSKVKYKSVKEPITIICPTHGEFDMLPLLHINSPTGCRECSYDLWRRGENNNNYNPMLTKEERELRRNYIGEESYALWRKEVFKRDSYKCVKCGNGGILNAHHKDSWHWCIERRTDVSNGATLCKNCHTVYHQIYSNRNNTESQFRDFIRLGITPKD